MSGFLDRFDPLNVLAMIGALLIAVIGHEIMHGLAAYMFGDSTAKNEGRLSLNPIKHIDPIGTIALPLLLVISGSGFLFGWAKPVPIDVYHVLKRGGNKAMIVVSLAGVAYNFALAFCAAILINVLFTGADEANFLFFLLFYLVTWNVVLAVFNLLPIPPLDGAIAIAHLAAIFGFNLARYFNRIGAWGLVVLIVVLATDLKKPLLGAMNAIISAMIG
ncbi:MAG: site-2 protease family protein [Helicobacteraceae bacterium]|jgi:Zn-dependent protease|nr:site-2 protease family protein [Helicobacteraceae bacterium]